MNNETFDLTVPPPRQTRILSLIAGVFSIAAGVLGLSGGEQVQLTLGFVLLVSGILHLVTGLINTPAGKFRIVFRDDHLEVRRGFSRARTIPWRTISEIHVQPMSVDLLIAEERASRIPFDRFDYSAHQEIKPRIIAAFIGYAEAKGISLVKDQGNR